MKMKLMVQSIEERQWQGKQGSQSGLRYHCIDGDLPMSLTHFVQVNQPIEMKGKHKQGDHIDFMCRTIRQWSDGTVLLQGDIVDAKK